MPSSNGNVGAVPVKMPSVVTVILVPGSEASCPPVHSVRLPDSDTGVPPSTSRLPVTYTSVVSTMPAGLFIATCWKRLLVAPGKVRAIVCGAVPLKRVRWLPVVTNERKQQPPAFTLPRNSMTPSERSPSA